MLQKSVESSLLELVRGVAKLDDSGVEFDNVGDQRGNVVVLQPLEFHEHILIPLEPIY